MLDLNKNTESKNNAHNLEKEIRLLLEQNYNTACNLKALNGCNFYTNFGKKNRTCSRRISLIKLGKNSKKFLIKSTKENLNFLLRLKESNRQNLDKKNEIIEVLKKLTALSKEPNHNYWQQAIKN